MSVATKPSEGAFVRLRGRPWLVDGVNGADEGDCAHAATQRHSDESKANSRTPVDTTEIA